MRTGGFDYDVAVVGYGPVGAVAANLLGAYGVRAAVFEREARPYPLPRAVNMTDDVVRVLQNAGLGEEVRAVVAPTEKIQLVSGGGAVLAEARVPRDAGYGFPAANLFYQPELEEVLRRGVERFRGDGRDGEGDGGVSLFLGHEVETLRFGGSSGGAAAGAALGVRDGGNGRRREVRARFVLGADGAHSVVRRAAGVPLRSLGFDQDWVVVDAELAEGAPGVGDPPMLRQVVDPRRPTTLLTLRGNRRRFEFMLLPGETKEGMRRPAMVRELLSRWVDPGEIRVVRAAGYRFHGLVAASWRNGPLFLLGDAAHQMPPFLGQGLGEGVRDAHNLAWKLRLVLEGAADPVLLDSYETERAPRATATVGRAIRVGRVVGTRNRAVAAIRDAGLRLAGRLPVGTYGPLGDAMNVDPSLGAGEFAGQDRKERRAAEGKLFVQPPVRTPDGKTLPLDEVLGPGWAVLARGRGVLRHLDPRARAFWGRIGARFLAVVPAGAGPPNAGDDALLPAVADVEGRLTGWLSRHGGAEAVILRPDRHVWGVFDAHELGTATTVLSTHLATPEGPRVAAPHTEAPARNPPIGV